MRTLRGRGPKTGSVRKKQPWFSYCLQVYESLQKKELSKREQVWMTADEISGRPKSFLMIRLTEYWNWSLREFLGLPFPGKKFCGWTDNSKSWPFTFLNAREWTHFSRGPLLFWDPRSREAELVFFFHNFLPWGIYRVTTQSTSPPISITKLPGIKDLSQAAKSGIHSPTAT